MYNSVFLKTQNVELKTVNVERWYGTEYHNQPISTSLQQVRNQQQMILIIIHITYGLYQALEKIESGAIEVDSNLHLPKPNEFIPTEFDTNKHKVLVSNYTISCIIVIVQLT